MNADSIAKMIAVFHAKMTAVDMLTKSSSEDLDIDFNDLTQKPIQALYAAKYSMILSSQGDIIANIMAMATRPEVPLVAAMDLGPLMIALNNAVRSIDAALQAAGVDMGLKEEWLKC